MTNADKIRSMTDEELAERLADIIDCWYCPTYQQCTEVKGCANVLKAWLKQEQEK